MFRNFGIVSMRDLWFIQDNGDKATGYFMGYMTNKCLYPLVN